VRELIQAEKGSNCAGQANHLSAKGWMVSGDRVTLYMSDP